MKKLTYFYILILPLFVSGRFTFIDSKDIYLKSKVTQVENSEKQFKNNDSLEVEKLFLFRSAKSITSQKTIISNLEKALHIINDNILTKEPSSNYFLLKKALILDELGYYYRKQTDYTLSLKSSLESLKIKEDIGETYSLCRSYRNLGRIYHHDKDSLKAFQYYTKEIRLADNTDVNVTSNFYESYININLEDGNGTQDYFLKHTGMDSINFETLGVDQVTLLDTTLSLYPNPASNIAYLNGNTNNLKQIEVFNSAGQRVLVKNNGFDSINISQLESAVYFVKLYTNNATKTIKLIKK